MRNGGKMKISKTTQAVLKNFSTINNSMLFRQGKTISVMSNLKNIFGSYVAEEEFPQEFAIYDLNQLLGAVSLFDDPEFNFSEESVTIVEGKNQQIYNFADPSTITAAPEQEIDLPSVDVEFELSKSDIDKLLKAVSINAGDTITVEGDGETVHAIAHRKAVPTSNKYKIEVGNTDKRFKFNFSHENFKMIPGDYSVKICAQGYSKFNHKEAQLSYFVALEADSSYAN